MIAHQVGGTATRDALFFSTFHVRALPQIVLISVVPTILLALGAPKIFARIGPVRAVSLAYVASAMLHLSEWAMLANHHDRLASLVLYLHVLMVPVLTSGFWSILSEGIDPRASRRQMARAALAASIGGVLGGVLALIVGVTAMLPVLAVLHLFCAAAAHSLGTSETRGQLELEDATAAGEGTEPGSRERPALHTTRYLKWLAGAVALLAMSAALVDFFFKAHVQAAFQSQQDKLRFFSSFYMSTSLLALLAQVFLSRRSIEKVGLTPTVAALPLGLALGSLGALIFPSLASATIARGSESVIRNSLFRSAYEPLYNAIPAREKNASKTVVDVGAERVGDALGYGAAWALLSLGAAIAGRAQVALAMLLAIGALLLARSIHAEYLKSLRISLRDHVERVNPAEILDSSTTLILTQQFRTPVPGSDVGPRPSSLVAQIAALGTGEALEIRRVLQGDQPIAPRLVPHVIPLLARDDLAGLVIGVLRQIAPSCTGQMVDHLLDPTVEFDVRRRIPRVLIACPSARAVEGLLAGLDDERFEIRLPCGRSLARMRETYPGLHVDPETIFRRVSREVEVERPVWVARQVVDAADDQPDSPLLDAKLRRRANRSLEHVFNLLTLVLPNEPLRLAFRALHTDDRFLRGTALEYLESILPRSARDGIWPFLEAEARSGREPQSKQAALAALRLTHESVEINLTTLQQRLDTPGGALPG